MIPAAKTEMINLDRFTLDTPGGKLECTIKYRFVYVNATFMTGTVVGDPDGDTMFLAVERASKDEDGDGGTIQLFRPDEMAVIAHLCSALVADEMAKLAPKS